MKKVLASSALALAFTGSLTPAFAAGGELAPSTEVQNVETVASTSSVTSASTTSSLDKVPFTVKVESTDGEDRPVTVIESVRETVEGAWKDSERTILTGSVLESNGSEATSCEDSLRRLSLTVGDVSTVLCETSSGWVELDPVENDGVVVTETGVVFTITDEEDGEVVDVTTPEVTDEGEVADEGEKAPVKSMVFAPRKAASKVARSSVKSLKAAETAGIAGNVYFDLNKNGQYDSGDEPVKGRTVYLKSSSGTKTTKTDSDGVYRFNGVTPDSYDVKVDLKGSKLTQVWVTSTGDIPTYAAVDFDGESGFSDVDFGLTKVAGSTDDGATSEPRPSTPESTSSETTAPTGSDSTGDATSSTGSAGSTDDTTGTTGSVDSSSDSDMNDGSTDTATGEFTGSDDRGRVDSGSITVDDGPDLKTASLSGVGMVAGALLAGLGLRRRNAYVRRH